MIAPSGLEVDVRPLAGPALASIEAEWTALQTDANPPPYLTFNWLESWATVYGRRQLRLIRISDPRGGLVAVGLLEELRPRRLRFAGMPITPIRGLLCREGYEAPSWRAVGEWLNRGSGWVWVEAQGVAAPDAELPGTVVTPKPWFAFELPGSFDEYLLARSPSRRREYRRRIRFAERQGATTTIVRGAETRAGFDLFVRLHSERAQMKGEIHPAIDDRLALMLARVAACETPELRLYVLEQASTALAAAVNLDHAGESWAYNTGFLPEAAHLSPGLIVRLASIRDAIERGARCYDLGPGDFPYKREMGAEPCKRVRLEMTRGSAAGRTLRIASLSRRRLRGIGWVRAAAGSLRNASARAGRSRI
jgi:CelD/BcsL family acetyltransferase involved in cellulose biosynthesis